MTRVRLGNKPDEIVDIPEEEIQDLIALGMSVERVDEKKPKKEGE